MEFQYQLCLIETQDSPQSFGKAYIKLWGTNLSFSIAFHPQIDGLSERTIRTLEDMFRACVLDFKGSWKKILVFSEIFL